MIQMVTFSIYYLYVLMFSLETNMLFSLGCKMKKSSLPALSTSIRASNYSVAAAESISFSHHNFISYSLTGQTKEEKK